MALGTVSAGTDVEVLSEALFCIYFAIWKKGGAKKTEYLSDTGNKSWQRVWERGLGTRSAPIDTIAKFNTWANYMGITRMIARVISDPKFRSKVNKIHNFVTGFPRSNPGLWQERLVDQQEAFWSSRYTNFTGNTYIAMRADEIPSRYDPYGVYENISKKVRSNTDFRTAIDKDKWNPSDIWIFAPSAITALVPFKTNLNNQVLQDDEYKIGYMNALNNRIWELYQSHKLYPVSLKAPGASVRITAENQKEGSADYAKVVRYTGTDYTRDNQDAKVGFAVDLYDNRTRRITEKNYMAGILKVKTATISGMGSGGGSRLEIEVRPASGARYGTIGTDLQRLVIEQTDQTGIMALQRIRRRFPDLWRLWWSAQSNWLGRAAYSSTAKEYIDNQQDFIDLIRPYTNALYEQLNNGQSAWDPPRTSGMNPELAKVWVSKTHAGEIGVAIDAIMNQAMKDITVENLFNLAASQKVQTGTSQSQLKRRLRTLDQSLKEDLKRFPPAKANLVWNSGFHLVVK